MNRKFWSCTLISFFCFSCRTIFLFFISTNTFSFFSSRRHCCTFYKKFNLIKALSITCSLFFVNIEASLAQSLPLTPLNYETKFLSKGEQLDLPIKGLKKLSIGNKEILRIKVLTQSILVKGQSIGFSDLITWSKSGKKTYKIYVLTKKMQMDQLLIAQEFEGSPLKIDLRGETTSLSGVVQEIALYKKIMFALESGKSLDTQNLKLTADLKQKIKEALIIPLLQRGPVDIDCYFENIQMHCNVDKKTADEDILTDFKKMYHVEYHQRNSLAESSSHRLKILLFQTNHLKIEQMGQGLESLTTNLNNLFHNHTEIANGQSFNWSNGNHIFKLIAQPTLTISLNSKSHFESGQEIAFTNTSPQGQQNTQWKFAGLSIDVELIQKNGHYVLKHSTQLTQPIGQQISGFKENSEIFISNQKVYKIFEFEILQSGKELIKFPILSQIPLLGNFFTANKEHLTKQYLTGLIYLE